MMDYALVLAGIIHLPVICVTKTAGRIFSLSAGSSLELVYAAEHAPSPPQQQDALSDDESETTMSREPPQRIFATCSTCLTPALVSRQARTAPPCHPALRTPSMAPRRATGPQRRSPRASPLRAGAVARTTAPTSPRREAAPPAVRLACPTLIAQVAEVSIFAQVQAQGSG
eukprot:COSAG04_NODE_12_length_42844_cov_6.769213_15_plen_171_part_00